MFDLIDTYEYYLLFIYCQYEIHNGKGRLFGIVVHHFKNKVLYIAIMTIMNLFISLFLYLLHTIGFPCLNLLSSQKIRNNTVEASFGILDESTELKNNLRFKQIVESEIIFPLEFDQ